MGAEAKTKPGKPLRVVRTIVAPGEVAFVVAVPGEKPAKVRWSSYCEFDSDDDEKVEDGGVLSGRGVLTAYPGTFAIAKLCYVSVLVTPAAGVTATLGFFATPRQA